MSRDSDAAAEWDVDKDLERLLREEAAYRDWLEEEAHREPADATNPHGLAWLADVNEERVTWLWRGWLPRGKLVMFDGDPDLGKSVLWADLVARATNGGPMPDGSTAAGTPCRVLVMSAEDDVADTIVPRLRAAGADMSKVATLPLRRDKQGRMVPFSLPDDLARLQGALDETGARFFVIDPVAAHLSESVNSHNDASLRRAMTPLAAVAQAAGAVGLLIRHLNKDTGNAKALYRGGGSIGFIGAARLGWLVASDPDDESRRVLAQQKNNLSRGKSAALAYKLISWRRDLDIPVIAWQGSTAHTANDLLAAPDARKAAPDREEAKQFWTTVLENGPVRMDAIYDEADRAGLSRITVKRAARAVKVKKAAERADGKIASWWAYGPGQDDQLPPGCRR